MHYLSTHTLFGFGLDTCLFLLLIALPTFFFWKWLLKRFIKTTLALNITSTIVTLIITPLIYAGLIYLVFFGPHYIPDKDFDQKEWAVDIEGRFQMADDIIDNKLVIGKDTSQLKQMLGEPGYRDSANAQWTYDMGMGGGHGLGGWRTHELILKFDHYKVVSAEHKKYDD